MALQNYQQNVADWRARLRENERKTKMVIAIFVALYVLVGLLVDVYAATYLYQVDVNTALFAVIYLKVVPYGTLIMLGVAGLSLLITYALYDRLMLLGTDYHLVSCSTTEDAEANQLYNVVEEMKIAAGLNYMPKVFIIEASYMNAFASGYSEKSAMVAITRGLMQKLSRAELQAVMAHELSHIRHQDIKLNLTVAVLSNIMLIVIDILFRAVLFGPRGGSHRDRKNNGGAAALILVVMILRFVLPILTVLLSLFLSRTREYMADAGAIELMRDNEPLASALMKITYDHRENASQYSQEYGRTSHEQVRRAAYIYDPGRIDPIKSLTNALSTHPTLEQRLKAMGFTKKSN